MPSDEELQAMTGVSDIQMAAISDHELFDSWVQAGFTREEALQLILVHKKGASDFYAMHAHCPECNKPMEEK